MTDTPRHPPAPFPEPAPDPDKDASAPTDDPPGQPTQAEPTQAQPTQSQPGPAHPASAHRASAHPGSGDPEPGPAPTPSMDDTAPAPAAVPATAPPASDTDPGSSHAAPPRAPSGRGSRDRRTLLFFKDNLEAFAVAIVMALVIKHFCVEAFKIPTSSMHPTLRGDHDHGEYPGDRILVNKFEYLLRNPGRWEVMVFRYPLNLARNFIKRTVGLPGEHLRIHRGDIWIKPAGSDAPFRQARKNRRVREQLYTTFYPQDTEYAEPTADLWRVAGAAGAWRFPSDSHFEFVGGPAADVVARHAISEDETADGWRGNTGGHARDIRVRLRVERGPPSPVGGAIPPTAFEVSWSPDGSIKGLLHVDEREDTSVARVTRAGATVAEARLDVRLLPRSTVDLELEYVDGDVRIHVDGKEVAVLPTGIVIDDIETDGGTQDLRFRAEGAPLTIRGLRLDRDLHYMNTWHENRWAREGIVIPEDCYIMLGDNTGHSSDSRKWVVETVHVKGQDGPIRFDVTNTSEAGRQVVRDEHGLVIPGRVGVTDVQGVWRTWDEDDELSDGYNREERPYVWRDLIVGRAFLIFWPLQPDFPGRLHFFH